MSIRWPSPFSPRSRRARRSRKSVASRPGLIEHLECRALLAGDVRIELVDGNARITGDAEANSVEIIAAGNTVVVRGFNGTKINGAAADFVLSGASTTFAGHLTAELGDGNDRLVIHQGLTIGGSVEVRGQAGNDTLGINGATINGLVHLAGGTGTNGLSVQNATLGRSLWMTSSGTATLNIATTTIARDLHVSTGTGDDDIVLNGVTVQGDTTIRSGLGDDDIVIRNSTLRGRLDVVGQGGDDVLFVEATTVDRRAHFDMRLGRDAVQIQGASNFQRTVVYNGGAGRDNIEVTAPATVRRLRTVAARGRQVDDALITERITSPTTGAIAAAAALAAQFNPNLTVTVAADTVVDDANATATTLTVTRTGSTTAPLVVNLTSSVPAKATVPVTATIPAGAVSVVVNINTVGDSIADSDVTVTFTATAAGFNQGTDTLVVTNNDTAVLTLTPATATVVESAGSNAVQFTVHRNSGDISQVMTVALVSSAPSRLTVPASVTIPANSRTAQFFAAPVNNTAVDGTATVTITATATGLANGTATVTVTDDESPALNTSLNPATISENAGASASVLTVTRASADTSASLTVNLGLSATGRISIPATITIPAGQSTQTVAVSAIDNSTVDGSASIQITASATGFSSSTSTLTVNDDDNARLSLSLPSSTVAENSGSLIAIVGVNQVLPAPRTVTVTYSEGDAVTGPASIVIPAGQTSVSLPLTIVNGAVISGSETVTIRVNATEAAQDSKTLTVTDNDPIPLTTDISSNVVVPSNGTVITQASQFVIRGVTSPGAVVTVDSDSDGQFDDGTATAGVDGSYSVTVPLTHTSANRGAHQLVVRAVLGSNQADTLIPVHRAVGSVYRFETNLGSWDVELLNTAAPNTVQNFKSYADSPTAYQNLIVHRSVSNFVIQAGGFTVNGGEITSVATNPPIANEFNAQNSNLRGTLSMAQLGGQPNSGTSQWFINVVDNVSLNAARHTVFGHVIGTGMTVVDAINSLMMRNLNSLYSATALGEVPLREFNPANTVLTGTLSTAAGSPVVTGAGTLFTTQVQAGDSLRLGSTTFFVQSVDSNTQLTLKAPAGVTLSGVTGTVDVVPDDSDFVVFSEISELLAAL